jgi:two-component system sensor histidine kinase/response regulator
MSKILVIEDEHSLREDILDILTYEHFQVIGCQNGLEGVKAARNKLPDLIICDVMMPELDGYGVLMEVRSDPATANIPLIFLTAKTSRADMRRGMELGADDYLTKPFTHQELTSAVKTRLEKQANIMQEYHRNMESLRENVIRALPHELRTPLTGIMGYSRMLMEDADTIDAKQIFQMAHGIDKAARRMHRLTENYLLYAQIEIILTDRERLSSIRQNSIDNGRPYVTKAIQQKAAEYERSQDVDYECEPTALPISGESLDKIVVELMDNALKFSESGTPIIVRGVCQTKYFDLSITNLGRGMSADQIASIGAYMQFERRIYEQTGVGLGLIIAKRLTEIHGGSLEITSNPNSETTILLKLPLANS